MTDNTERLHTLNGNNIPAEAKGYPEKNRIGMDTGHRRNFLQLWIGRRRPTTEEEKKNGLGADVFVSESVHLTREDAERLIEEIEERLF